MEILIIVLTGAVVGFVSAFFGVGGGSILLPIFYSAFSYMEPIIAIPISLGTIFLNTLSNNYTFYKTGIFPSRKTLLIFVITCSVGILIGSALVLRLEPVHLKKFLGLVLLVILGKILFSKKPIDQSDKPLEEPPLALGLTGFFGAILAGLTGLGGGIIYVPMFMTVVKLPFKYITPFSNVAMGLGAGIGVIPYLTTTVNLSRIPELFQPYFLGSVNFLIIGILFISGFGTRKLGVHLNNSVSPNAKRYWLSAIIGALTIKILLF